MSNYKIRVKIEIEESEEENLNRIAENEDGGFEINIDQMGAESIDICEQAMLKVDYHALRNAISRHLTELSKKRAISGTPKGPDTFCIRPFSP